MKKKETFLPRLTVGVFRRGFCYFNINLDRIHFLTKTKSSKNRYISKTLFEALLFFILEQASILLIFIHNIFAQ